MIICINPENAFNIYSEDKTCRNCRVMLGIILFNVARYASQNNPRNALHLRQVLSSHYDA